MFVAKKLEHGMNWVNAAPSVQTEVNTRISVSRKSSPFKSVFGYNPKVGPSILPHPIPVYSEPTERHYNSAENLTKAKDQQATQANKRRQPSHNYKAGDQVLLSTENLPTQYRASKLSPKWICTFPITQYLPWRQTAMLDLTEEPELSNTSHSFHTSLLKPFIR